MTTKKDIINLVKENKYGNENPIYEIMCFEHPEKELIYETGKHSGFPDTGATNTVGFYHDIDDAVTAVLYNMGDIHETCYDACFILCRFPGLYDGVTKERRMYFVYNNSTKQYEQKEEPRLFTHIAY